MPGLSEQWAGHRKRAKYLSIDLALRATGVKAIHDRLAELNVISWDFEAVGLILVLVGTVLTQFPDCAAADMIHGWCG